MTRITGGKYKNRKLETKLPKGVRQIFRPTQARIRESIFNRLLHSEKLNLSDGKWNVMDLYCGCGTFGFEAISRGAERVVFIDKICDNIELVKRSSQVLEENDKCSFIVGDARTLRNNVSEVRYNLIYLDPPYYSDGMINKTLEALRCGNWLMSDHIIIIEISAKEDYKMPYGFKVVLESTYGGTRLIYLQSIN